MSDKFVTPAVVFETFARSRYELVVREHTPRDTDDRNVQPAANQCLKRRNNLLVGQITSGTEKYERVGPVRHTSNTTNVFPRNRSAAVNPQCLYVSRTQRRCLGVG